MGTGKREFHGPGCLPVTSALLALPGSRFGHDLFSSEEHGAQSCTNYITVPPGCQAWSPTPPYARPGAMNQSQGAERHTYGFSRPCSCPGCYSGHDASGPAIPGAHRPRIACSGFDMYHHTQKDREEVHHPSSATAMHQDPACFRSFLALCQLATGWLSACDQGTRHQTAFCFLSHAIRAIIHPVYSETWRGS